MERLIVERLNAEPFRRNLNLISLDAMPALGLLQLLSDVLVHLDPRHTVDVREESPDQTAMRLLGALKLIKYKPPEEDADRSGFRQGLVSGDKTVIYQLLVWLLPRLDELKKRAYLGRFLQRLDVPAEHLQDPSLADAHAQYEELLGEFTSLHKAVDQLRASGFNSNDIRKDIAAMEEERETLEKRVDRLKRKGESVSGQAKLLEAVHGLRVEREREEALALQKSEQRNQLFHVEQKLQRSQQQLQDLKHGSTELSSDSVARRMEEELRFTGYLCREKLPAELGRARSHAEQLQRVARTQGLAQGDLDALHTQIGEVGEEVSVLLESRMRRGDPGDDKLVLFRQQAAIISRKRAARAEELQEARERLQEMERQSADRQRETRGHGDSEAIGGDEFKRYVARLRSKNTVYKRQKQQLWDVRAETGVLTRTRDLLAQRLSSATQRLHALEERRGVSGFSDTQDDLEKVSQSKRQHDDSKARTLGDMSHMVRELNALIAEKKAALSPVIKELRPLRQHCQELGEAHERSKAQYESCAAGLESNRSQLEQEVRALREEVRQAETRYHHINQQSQMVQLLLERAGVEIRAYVSPDIHERKKALREQYNKLILEQDNVGKKLRERQRSVRESHAPSLQQVRMWRDVETLLLCKLKQGHQDQPGVAAGPRGGQPGRSASGAAREERLVLS